MNTKSILILLTLTLFVAIPARGQQPAHPFSSAKTLPEKSYEQFEFSHAGSYYTIFSSGRGQRERNGKTRSFNIRVSRSSHLEGKIYFMGYQGDLLLICEESDELYGGGFIVRLDGRTLKTKWRAYIQGFNVGQGLIDGKYAYVTGIGFVGKVDLNSGRYVWQNRDLYQQGIWAFNSFELPEVQGETVIFREQPQYNRKKQAVVRIDRANGKIISLDH